MDVKTLACVDSSLMVCIWSDERLELKRRGREKFGMLPKFAATLLLFLSRALDTVNNTIYENMSDQERCVFPTPHVNFPFNLRVFQNAIPSFILRVYYCWYAFSFSFDV